MFYIFIFLFTSIYGEPISKNHKDFLSQVLIIRHAEKPDDPDEVDLSFKGKARASALSIYFPHLLKELESENVIAIFAQGPAKEDSSLRSILTMIPTSLSLV